MSNTVKNNTHKKAESRIYAKLFNLSSIVWRKTCRIYGWASLHCKLAKALNIIPLG